MILFVDTETTGLPTRRHAHYTDVSVWPRIVSISWAFYRLNGEKAHYDYRIIRPDGFTIPREVTEIHGITTERALREGQSLRSVLESFNREVQQHSPCLLVAHNMAFDRPIILAEHVRAGLSPAITSLSTFCTMEKTTALCRLPRRGHPGQYKWPKLVELHYHLFGFEYSASHHAGADVSTCAKCYFKLVEMGLASLPSPTPTIATARYQTKPVTSSPIPLQNIRILCETPADREPVLPTISPRPKSALEKVWDWLTAV